MPSVSKIFERMPDEVSADKAAGFEATIQFDLSGESGGQWVVVVADGDVTTEEGQADDPKATIRMSADDFSDMMTGDLDPMNAFMMGKVKVEGDLNTVMKFQTLFG